MRAAGSSTLLAQQLWAWRGLSERVEILSPAPVPDAKTYLRRLSDELIALQKPIRILKAINWDPKVHHRFFSRNGTELPSVEYPPLEYDAGLLIRELGTLKRRARGRNPVEGMLRRKCDEFVLTVRMLSARGTRRFHAYSVELYGNADERLPGDRRVDNLGIARAWASRPAARAEMATLTSGQAVTRISTLINPVLGRHCRVKESTRITANAAAGGTHVSIRKGATFSERQANALAHHEGLWHVLTSLNGYRQPVLTMLGVGLPRFTESQEGGGIVAEYLSGNMTNDRFRELGERTIAVDMAARGADYLQVYGYLAQRFAPQKASQMCERVFRGGLLEGGAPFTKDAVYQRGYCRVYNFIRIALAKPDLDLLLAFLSGKMAVEDAWMVKALIAEGLCVGPSFLPEWCQDLDSLLATITHSLTMNRFSTDSIARYLDRRVARQIAAAEADVAADLEAATDAPRSS
jgi:uncharacterized protein (TIGR02421 family)